jgi:hypothetical protein
LEGFRSALHLHFLNAPHINNRPLKTSPSYAKSKLNRRVGRQRQPIFFSALRAPDSHPDLWWALPATNRCMMGLQVVMLSAPTSLASIMVIGPHHAAVTYAGGSSEVGQREHMVRQGFTRKCWSEFLCLGGYLAPPRQVGGLPRGMRSADTPPPTPAAGAPPAGGPDGVRSRKPKPALCGIQPYNNLTADLLPTREVPCAWPAPGSLGGTVIWGSCRCGAKPKPFGPLLPGVLSRHVSHSFHDASLSRKCLRWGLGSIWGETACRMQGRGGVGVPGSTTTAQQPTPTHPRYPSPLPQHANDN